MNDRTIFEAMERFEKGIKLLAYWGWRALPVVEDAVRRKDQFPKVVCGKSSMPGCTTS